MRGNQCFGLWSEDGLHLLCIMPCDVIDGFLVKYWFFAEFILEYFYFLGNNFFSLLDKCDFLNLFRSKLKRVAFVRSNDVFLGNFAFVEFCGVVCPIPEFVEDYLAFRFDDWRTPVRYVGDDAWLRLYHRRSYL